MRLRWMILAAVLFLLGWKAPWVLVALAIAGLVYWKWPWRRRLQLHNAYAGIVGFVGYMGSGKTAALVKACLEALRAGRPVYTNAGFVVVDHEPACEATGDKDCDCPVRSQEYFSLEELSAVERGAFVAIDEAQNFVWSRKSNQFPRGVMARMRYGRKDALSIFWSAVDEMDVDVVLRRSTAFVVHNQRIGNTTWFRQYMFPPVDKRRADDRPLKKKYHRFKSDVLRAYDTFAHNWISPEVIEQIKDDVQKGWVPQTPGLSEAIMSRDAELIDEELKTAHAMAREYIERVRSARRSKRAKDLPVPTVVRNGDELDRVLLCGDRSSSIQRSQRRSA